MPAAGSRGEEKYTLIHTELTNLVISNEIKNNINMAEKLSTDRAKQIRIRVEKNLLNVIKNKAKEYRMPLSSYINLMFNSSIEKQEISFEEKLIRAEKKEIESRVFFTKSEAELLRQYAFNNDWSLAKELRYRVISTLSEKPKLSGEELKLVYSVRSSINILGANLNRLLRNNQTLCEDNMSICKELLELIKELVSKINYLERYSHTHFRLKEIRSLARECLLK